MNPGSRFKRKEAQSVVRFYAGRRQCGLNRIKLPFFFLVSGAENELGSGEIKWFLFYYFLSLAAVCKHLVSLDECDPICLSLLICRGVFYLFFFC